MEARKKSGLLGGVATVMNAGGHAVVVVCEKTSGALGDVVSAVRNISFLPTKVGGLFSRSDSKNIEEKIRDYETKIKMRYLEIGKESAHTDDLENTLQKESIQKLISDIREYEQEVMQLKDQIVELKAGRKKAQRVVPEPEAAEVPAFEPLDREQAERNLRAAIDRAVHKGVFKGASDKAIFTKVAQDLFDNDVEVRMLATAELGKMGNPVATPVLMEVARQGDTDLTIEALNGLITLGGPAAIGLFKELASHPKYRVRMLCLRGIYKLATDEEAGPLLIAALWDEHPEVRRTAVTFLGWKDYADTVPSLVQCLRDEDDNVRKGTVAALANLRDQNSVLPLLKVLGDKNLEIREKALEALRSITGESIAFDVNARNSVLEEGINSLITWWQDKLIGKVAAAPAPAAETPAATAPAPEAAPAPAKEAAPAKMAVQPEAASVPSERNLKATAIVDEVAAQPRSAQEPLAASDDFSLPSVEWDGSALGTVESPQAGVLVTPAEPAPAKKAVMPTMEALNEMNKADLIAQCERMGVECDPKLNKAEIKKLLLKSA